MIINASRKNLGKLLKQQRKSARMTLYELSNSSGVSTSHLGRIENGERFPSADVLQKIARPLGFAEEELFSLAGYLSPQVPSVEKPVKHKLDPNVEKTLAQEPVEIQKAVLEILALLKTISEELKIAKTQ